jgi:phosphatidate cytidylyltransferase
LVLLIAERRHLHPLEICRRPHIQRWLVWAVIAVVYALAVLAGYITVLLLISVIVFQALREYASLVGLKGVYRIVLLLMGLIAAPVAIHSSESFLALPPLLLLVATLQPLFLRDVRTGTRHLAFAALGWAYLPLLLGHFLLLHKYIGGGPGILLAIGLAVALSDIGAFTFGKAFGRHKLIPLISPNKTWEGVAGNFIGAALGIVLMGFALPQNQRLLLMTTLPIIVAVGALWGDLLESLIKREFQVKDAGAWLPGFGGLLDRIDSLIIAVPLAYYYLRIVT